jgi:hypothetical protein
MTLKEALQKTDMAFKSGKYYYNTYLEDPDHDIPIPQRQPIQEQREAFHGCIINDKMSTVTASIKANITIDRGFQWHKDIEKQNPGISIAKPTTSYCRYRKQAK